MSLPSVVVVPDLASLKMATRFSRRPRLRQVLRVVTLSSALPLLLDIYALKRLPRVVFGDTDECRAAMSAVAGLLILGETLGGLQWVGIGAITIACAGSGILSARQSRASVTTR